MAAAKKEEVQLTTTSSGSGLNPTITTTTDPWMLFLYALKALATKEKYIQRLTKFLDFLDYPGTKEEKARAFADRAKTDPVYTFSSVLKFFQTKREQIDRKEMAIGTVRDTCPCKRSTISDSIPDRLRWLAKILRQKRMSNFISFPRLISRKLSEPYPTAALAFTSINPANFHPVFISRICMRDCKACTNQMLFQISKTMMVFYLYVRELIQHSPVI